MSKHFHTKKGFNADFQDILYVCTKGGEGRGGGGGWGGGPLLRMLEMIGNK